MVNGSTEAPVRQLSGKGPRETKAEQCLWRKLLPGLESAPLHTPGQAWVTLPFNTKLSKVDALKGKALCNTFFF